MEPLAAGAVVVDCLLGPGDERSLADDVLDGLTRPFKELPPKHFYDARGADLFDQICELPEYYPTRAERAILLERADADRRAHGGRGARRAGLGDRRRRRACCCARWPRPARCAATSRSTSPRRWCASRAEQLVEELPGLRVHGIVGDFERHLAHVPPAQDGPRIVAFLGGTIGNFTPGSAPALPARDRAAAAPRPRLPAAGHRPRQGPCRDRGRLRRRRRRHRRVQPQRARTWSTASSTPTSTSRPSSTSPSSTASASGSRCACARRGGCACGSARSGWTSTSRPREELRTEISAKFTPRAPARRPRGLGPRPARGAHRPRRSLRAVAEHAVGVGGAANGGWRGRRVPKATGRTSHSSPIGPPV